MEKGLLGVDMAIISVRLDDETKIRLDETAAERRETRSSLIQRYVEEGLRMDDHPGVVFRDGPAGRRPGLAGGPDVWEVVRVIVNTGAKGEAALEVVAEELGLSPSQAREAISYYAVYKDEVDRWIAMVDTAADKAEEAWRRQVEALA